MEPSQKTSRSFFTKPIVIACLAVVIAAGLYALWAVNVNHPKQGKTSASDCTPSLTLVNPCRPWVGAASGGYTQTASDTVSQLTFLNKRINDPNVLTDPSLSPVLTHKIDIAHIYKPPGSNLLSAGDKTLLANNAFPYVMINWKPLPSNYVWKDAAGGNATVDNYIKAGADALRGINKKVFLTPFHEPENDVSAGNCAANATGAGMGSPADYVAMWANVRKIFKDEYAATGTPSDIVWVVNFMGFSKWNCLIPQLWPGNDKVDWITWDPYGSGTSGYTSSVDNLYNYLLQNSDTTHDYKSKAWGLNEYGYGSSASTNFNEAGSEQYWKDALDSLNTNKYPLLKMYDVFDTNANNAHSQIGNSIDGTANPAKQTLYNSFANAIFAKQTTTPTPDTTAPTVTVSVPGSGTTLTKTVSAAATASDNIGVTDVKFYVDTTLIKDDTTASDGWSVQWDTTTIANGTHTLKAVAYDAAGNNKTSTSDVVVNNPVLPTINSFTASPSSIASGGKSTLSWTTTDITSCAVTPGGPANTTGTAPSWQTGALTTSTTFTLTCVNGATTISKTALVTVMPAPVINSFSADPSTTTMNGTSMLSWATTNTSSCSVGPNGSSDMTTTSWQTLGLTTVGTTTYTLTCKNNVGITTSATTNVTVTAPPTAPTKVVLTASANTVTAGGAVTISWTSTGSDYCLLYPGAFKATGTTSSKTITNFKKTTIYYVDCYNAVGKTESNHLTVNVGTIAVANPVITHLGAYPNPVAYRGQSTLYWSSDNVPKGGCAVTPSPLSSTWPNGQYTTPHLTSSTTYTLICKNTIGIKTQQSITINVSSAVGLAHLRSADMQLTAAHLHSYATSASTNSSTTADSTTIKASTGETVVDAGEVSSVAQGSFLALDPGTITDSAQIAQISRLEYYNGSKLIETVTQPPFALQTNLLSVGSSNVTERVYFKDGSTAQTSQLITITGKANKKNSGAPIWLIATGTGIVLVALAAGAYMMRSATRKRAHVHGVGGAGTMPTSSAYGAGTPAAAPRTVQPQPQDTDVHQPPQEG